MIFIAGIQPRRIRLKSDPLICRQCGRPDVVCFRQDHYLSIFFIPLIRVSKGELVWSCQSCGAVRNSQINQENSLICSHCQRNLQPDFAYCPYCGRKTS